MQTHTHKHQTQQHKNSLTPCERIFVHPVELCQINLHKCTCAARVPYSAGLRTKNHACLAEFGMPKSCLSIRLPKSFSWVNLFFILTRSSACAPQSIPSLPSLIFSCSLTHTRTLAVWLSVSSSWQRNYRHFAAAVSVTVGVAIADASASLTAIEWQSLFNLCKQLRINSPFRFSFWFYYLPALAPTRVCNLCLCNELSQFLNETNDGWKFAWKLNTIHAFSACQTVAVTIKLPNLQ